jgi:Na+-translocating ferredoxin:NAD+ oxidoreductase subunit C
MVGRFFGGIHPQDNKKRTRDIPIQVMPLIGTYHVPLKQHIGEACVPLVAVGDMVYKGQRIADASPARSAPIHAPVSGRIADIGTYRDPVAGMAQCITITSDGKDEWLPNLQITRDYTRLSAPELLAVIRDCGIVGMGGAAFPCHTKLSPPQNKTIDTLVINGAECEPYLTSDYRVMLEYPDDIIRGCLIAMKILGVKYCYVGIEDNKRNAIAILSQKAAPTPVRIVALPTKYPQGGEKMLIKAVCKREVGSGKLPMDAGCVVHNVSTMKAICNAVEKNIPLIERVVTVSGSAISSPKNVLVRIGTGFSDVIDYCNGFTSPPTTILMGGPMMGIAQADAGAPVIKACSAILAFAENDMQEPAEGPCIRCGRCTDACAMKLRPYILSLLSEQRKYQTALLEYDLLDCIECGCCAYVCPAKRNIVQYVRLAKAKNALMSKQVRK